MKKILLTILLLSSALWVDAQSVGLSMSILDNDYFGSARSSALGNAMTALGSDIGSMQINPAGTSVANYSQVVISPVLCINTVKSSYAAVADYSPMRTGVSANGTNTRVSSIAPSTGCILNFNTGNKNGLRNVAFGFSLFSAPIEKSDSYIRGINDAYTSLSGSLAVECTGYTEYDLASAYSNGIYWPLQLAYKSGMIRAIDGSVDTYLGAAEVVKEKAQVGGSLYQDYSRVIRGEKDDFVINFSANIAGKLFLGANIGIPVFDYSSTWTQKETAVNPNDFEYYLNGKLTHFRQLNYSSWERLSATGIYGKFGLIFVPVKGLRLGAAIQTPTSFRIRRQVDWSGYTDFDNQYGESVTPEGREEYKIINPFRYNFGAALTFSKYFLVSVDWEGANFNQMRYESSNQSYFDQKNQEVRDYAGMSSTIRAGIEIKPVQAFAIRAGYTRNERTYDGAKDLTTIWSGGLGYSSGAFSIDFVTRYKTCPTEWWYPYNDYITGTSGDVFCAVPELSFGLSSVDMMLTFAFRF